MFYNIHIPQNGQGHGEQGKTEWVSQPEDCGGVTKYTMVSWIEFWNGKKDSIGETGEIQMKCGV